MYKLGGDGAFGSSGGFVGTDGLVIAGGGTGAGRSFVVVSGGWGRWEGRMTYAVPAYNNSESPDIVGESCEVVSELKLVVSGGGICL